MATKVNGVELLDTSDELGDIIKSHDKVKMVNSGIRVHAKLRFAVIRGAAYSRINMANDIVKNKLGPHVYKVFYCIRVLINRSSTLKPT